MCAKNTMPFVFAIQDNFRGFFVKENCLVKIRSLNKVMNQEGKRYPARGQEFISRLKITIDI